MKNKNKIRKINLTVLFLSTKHSLKYFGNKRIC